MYTTIEAPTQVDPNFIPFIDPSLTVGSISDIEITPSAGVEVLMEGPGGMLFIEADWNDGDYVSELTPVTQMQLFMIQPILVAIKRDNRHEIDLEYYEGQFSSEALEFLERCLPSTYQGQSPLHTLERVLLFTGQGHKLI